MTTNNAINNSLPTPFNVGGVSVTSTGTQLNLLNAMTVVPFDMLATQVFTSSGTYTPTAGMKYCMIECVGGGGGSGGATSTTSNCYASSAGGGGGSYARKFSTAADIGVSQTVTIGSAGAAGTSGGANNGGDGGDTSVGSLCIGKGGSGGQGSVGGLGGVGGIAGTGDFTIVGGDGGDSTALTVESVPILSGGGGGTFFSPTTPGTYFPPGFSNPYGGGACGSTAFDTGSVVGAAGSKGVIVITEFLSA